MVYEVLDHDPTGEDITRFFRRFREALEARGLSLRGITTDGSALYPAAIAEVFGSVPHRKMQKTVYRVRTQETIRCRMALDMQRDLHAPARRQTTATLHQQRRETG